MTMSDFERTRVVLLGDAGVGKSCIIKRFLFKTYTDKYRATVEDLFNREYDLGPVTLKVSNIFFLIYEVLWSHGVDIFRLGFLKELPSISCCSHRNQYHDRIQFCQQLVESTNNRVDLKTFHQKLLICYLIITLKKFFFHYTKHSITLNLLSPNGLNETRQLTVPSLQRHRSVNRVVTMLNRAFIISFATINYLDSLERLSFSVLMLNGTEKGGIT